MRRMRLKRLAWALALAMCVALSQAAFAQRGQPQKMPTTSDSEDTINPDRPGIADGSMVVGGRRFQAELGVQHEYRSDAGASEHTLFIPTLLRFGINDRWEARIETNGYIYDRLFSPGAGIARTDGYAPVSFGFKHHWQDSKGPEQPSLGVIFRVFPPSGSGAFSSSHAQFDLRLAADWDFAPGWSLNPNIGVGGYEDGNGDMFTAGLFAFTLTRIVDKRIQVFADMALQSPEQATDARPSTIADAGITYLLDKNSQVDASAGTGIGGHTPPRPFWSVGYSRRF